MCPNLCPKHIELEDTLEPKKLLSAIQHYISHIFINATQYKSEEQI